MKKGSYFITGTNTDAGKTYVTALLTRSLRERGKKSAAIKPISCGGRQDVEALYNACSGELAQTQINFLHYDLPLAPLPASEEATSEAQAPNFSPSDIITPTFSLAKEYDYLFVEGIGGWIVPITNNYTTVHLAQELGFPILLVVRNRLGALNHTLLTLEAIARSGLHCSGILVNHHPEDEGDPAQPGNRRYFRKLGLELYYEIFPYQDNFLI